MNLVSALLFLITSIGILGGIVGLQALQIFNLTESPETIIPYYTMYALIAVLVGVSMIPSYYGVIEIRKQQKVKNA